MEYPGHRLAGLIGRGSFGEAHLFVDEADDGQLTAVKFLKGCEIDDRLAEYVKREIRNHQLLSGHPAIIRLKEVYVAPASGCLAVAMEFAGGGSLLDRIRRAGRFSEDTSRYFFQQLVQAVAWCHSKGVVHRDLKLDNLLLDKAVPDEALCNLDKLLERRPQVKLCDFGTSKSADLDSRPNTVVGTPAFTAPELFTGGWKGAAYSGEAVDVWACGITLYFMLVGDLPFIDPKSGRVSPQLMYQGRYGIPEGVEVSPSCRDLLSRVFVADPQRRITLADIQRDPWYRKHLPAGTEVPGAKHKVPKWLRFWKHKHGAAGGAATAAAGAPAPEPAAAPSAGPSEEELDRLIREARANCQSKSALKRQPTADAYDSLTVVHD